MCMKVGSEMVFSRKQGARVAPRSPRPSLQHLPRTVLALELVLIFPLQAFGSRQRRGGAFVCVCSERTCLLAVPALPSLRLHWDTFHRLRLVILCGNRVCEDKGQRSCLTRRRAEVMAIMNRRVHLAEHIGSVGRACSGQGCLLLRTGGGGSGSLRLHLPLGTLFQREVHPKGDGGGGAVFLKSIQVPKWKNIDSAAAPTMKASVEGSGVRLRTCGRHI